MSKKPLVQGGEGDKIGQVFLAITLIAVRCYLHYVRYSSFAIL